MSFFHHEKKEKVADRQQLVGDTAEFAKLSGENTVAEWLDHPVGGPIFRDMLQKDGQNEEVVRLLQDVPLDRLTEMDQNQFTKEMLDDMIRRTDPDQRQIEDQAPVVEISAEYLSEQQEDVANRLKGKTIIVMGAGSDIGRVTVSRLAREGSHVVAVDTVQAALDNLQNELNDVTITTVVADMTDEQSIQNIIDAASEGSVE